MDSKVIVKLVVPEIDQTYDIFLPVNRKIASIIELLVKSLNELSDDVFPISDTARLYNVDTMQVYQSNVLLANTDIRNGTRLVIIS